jgi:hypothetical protein
MERVNARPAINRARDIDAELLRKQHQQEA